MELGRETKAEYRLGDNRGVRNHGRSLSPSLKAGSSVLKPYLTDVLLLTKAASTRNCTTCVRSTFQCLRILMASGFS